MAGKGAPLGNNFAGKAKKWENAINRAIAQDDGVKLRAAAEKLLDLAVAGEGWAVKELGDRLDGRAKQQIELSSDPEAPVRFSLVDAFTQAARPTGLPATQASGPVEGSGE